MSTEDDELRQSALWESLYERLLEFLGQYGREEADRNSDFWVDDDNLGTPQEKIYVRNLELLNPVIIKGLQQILMTYPGWEIMIAISVPGKDEVWPDMGLTIREHEIIDGLQRQYLPEPYRNFFYEGSRPGTDRN